MKKILFFLAILISLSISSFFVFSKVASAQGYVPLADIPGLYDSEVYVEGESDTNQLSEYFKNLYKLGVGLATILAVMMVIWGGVEYVSTDAIGGKEEGKERIQNALLGLLLALGSYLILRTISPDLLKTNLQIDPLRGLRVEKFVTPQFADVPSAPQVDDRSSVYGPVDQRVSDAIDRQLMELHGSGSVNGKATNFGYRDSEDNGRGSALVGDGNGGRVDTNNSSVLGVALPSQVLRDYFGIKPDDTTYAGWASVRDAAVEVTGPNGQKEIVPIVDLGPGEEPLRRGVVVDETHALNQKMGGDGERSYRILPGYYRGKARGNVIYVTE